MLINGGKVILADGPADLDIRTRGEQISELGKNLQAEPDEQVIDATGFIVLPGLIDSHVHFREPGGTHKEDFFTGSQSALAGGVTTVLDMPNTQPPTESRQHLYEKATIVATKAMVDFGFYLGATDTNVEEAAALASEIAGLKMYMGSSTGSLLVTEFSPIYRHFSIFPLDKPLVVHAEDEQSLKYFAAQDSQNHNQRRPPLSAQIALTRALAVAQETGRVLHIAHVTTERELELIREAKDRGVRVTCEVTPLHLFLTEEDFQRMGNYAKVNPPLRSERNQKALWHNLNMIDTIATDHAPHTKAEKDQPYEKAPSGMPGVQTMLPLLFTAASEGRCSFEEIIERCVVNPARIFGLRSKGALEVGKDADIVLLDPQQEYIITNDQMYSRCGWTPFAGKKVKGRIHQVYLRGTLAFNCGEFPAQLGNGTQVRFRMLS